MSEKSTPLRIVVNERIYLSPIRRSDKGDLIRLLNDKNIYDCTLRIPFPYEDADAEQFFESVREATARHGVPVHFAIREMSGQLIGGIGFGDLSYGHRAEVGYWLAKSRWNQGIMTATLRSACAFAREQWKLVRITASVFEHNKSSARVLEKNGFALEGLLRKHYQKDDRFVDARLYGLVSQEE